tara:strand:- start:7383 stop:8447 length:1065 start_codon:yes stop_codon:yes gene_type:complete
MKKQPFLYLFPLILLLLFAYQNCGQELGELDNEVVANSTDTEPFPLETSLDTLGAMSCQGSSLNRGTYFTFAIMGQSADASGHRLIRTKKGLSFDEKQDFFDSSSKLPGTQLYFDIVDYQSTVDRGKDDITRAVSPYPLDNDFIKDILAAGSQWSLTGSSSRMPLDYRYSNKVRELFQDFNSNKIALHLGYINNDQQVINPQMHGDEGSSQAYGNTYDLAFSERGTLVNVDEYIMLDKGNQLDKKNVGWACNQYLIVPKNFNYSGGNADPCNATSNNVYSNLTNSNYPGLYKILGSGWRIYTSGSDTCIRHSTKSGCYTGSTVKREALCEQGNPQKQCPYYFSFCQKTRYDNSY